MGKIRNPIPVLFSPIDQVPPVLAFTHLVVVDPSAELALEAVEDPGEIRNLWSEAAAAGLKADLLHQFLQACLQYESMPMPRIAGA